MNILSKNRKKKQNFRINKVGLSYLDRFFNFIFRKMGLLFFRMFFKEKYDIYKPYENKLVKIARLQRLYYSKEVHTPTETLKYDVSTIPRIEYIINGKVLLLKCYFDGRAIKKDYERLKEEILTITGLLYIEDELKNGFYYLELGLLEDEILKPTLLKDLEEKPQNSIPIGDSFGKVIMWNYASYPHLLVIGGTGSGKSVFMNYILSSILSFTEVWCIDGKGVDYLYSKHYFKRYCDVSEPQKALEFIEDFYDLMQERKILLQNAIASGQSVSNIYEMGLNPIFLLIDENTSVVESLPAKAPNKNEESLRSRYNNKLGQIARLGRAYGTILLVAMQRPDTRFIDGETRANFICKIVLGSAEAESYRMMFGQENANLVSMSLAKGYVQIDSRLRYIKIPYVKEIVIDEKNKE